MPTTCACGCGTVTRLTRARQGCGCGCQCCQPVASGSKDREVAELTSLRQAIDERLAELTA